VAAHATGSSTGSQIALTITLNGTISAEDCIITFQNLSFTATSDQAGNIISPILATGGISATCSGDNIQCTLTLQRRLFLT